MKELLKKIWGWVRTDGLLHIETSALIMCLLTPWMAVWLAAIITLGIGVGKEVYDRYTQGSSTMHDIICDVIGIAAGALMAVPWFLLATWA